MKSKIFILASIGFILSVVFANASPIFSGSTLLALDKLSIVLPEEGEEPSESNNVTLSGYISDQSNGEVLIGATVRIKELGLGTATNAYGYYSLVVEKGNYTFEYSYIGYRSKSLALDIQASQKRNIQLFDASEELSEVIVTGEKKNSNVESVKMSTVKLPIKMVKKLPSFMGEVDILKSVQMLPGIQNGGEGSSGLYVRGGGPDENLLILDEAPVYNASHLMGFFSVFNSDAIKDIQVYKGGIPAQYGGKASSVIDIRMKDGNNKEWHMNGGVGTLSSRFTTEGPIIKDKWSVIFSGRLMYGPLLGRAMQLEELQDVNLYFYDLNGKTNIVLTDKNKLFASVYTGKDVFSFDEAIYMNWGNTTATMRWNHIFGDRLFSNTSFIYSKYNYSLGVPGSGADQFDWSSKIRDLNFKEDITWFLNSKNKISMGFNTILHHFEPGKIDVNDNSFFNDLILTYYNALDNEFYISNEQNIGSRLILQYGLRLSVFQQIGEGKVRYYQNPDSISSKDTAIRVEDFKTGKFIGSPYINLQPRLSAKFTLDEASSLKASYTRMVQNLHLISNTNSPTPLDIWLPSNKYLKPLIVDQIAVGYFRNFMNDAFETSLETYYKNMHNVVDYVDGAELFLNESLETQLLEGSGYSYGLEFLVKKQQGKFTGWTSYTLARTMRQIPGINAGKAYPSSYDRTHDISIILNYEINKNWNVSANWLFSTGSPTTYPVAKYPDQVNPNTSNIVDKGNTVYVYSDRNSYRIPNYHRMDMSVTFNPKKNEFRKLKNTFNLSVYNVYNRRNAYSITYRQNEGNPNISEALRLSIIGSIIPAFTWNFTF